MTIELNETAMRYQLEALHMRASSIYGLSVLLIDMQACPDELKESEVAELVSGYAQGVMAEAIRSLADHMCQMTAIEQWRRLKEPSVGSNSDRQPDGEEVAT